MKFHPVRDGVGASVIVLPVGQWPTVLDFLDERFPTVPREDIIARMQKGDVTDQNGAPILPFQAYAAHQKLYYYRAVHDEPPVPFQETIIFEDEWIVVADKPHFLSVTPAGRHLQETLLVRLKRRLGIDTLAPMHRIDRETAGLVIFTKKPEARGQYQMLFQDQRVNKTYLAVAPINDALALPMIYRSRIVQSAHFMQMREEVGEPNAIVEISMVARNDKNALYRLQPITGKKHQLRVQMAALSMPILHDEIYPNHIEYSEAAQQDFSRPLQLLAHTIAFTDPITGAARQYQSARTLAFAPPA